jgi:hypothetical protein
MLPLMVVGGLLAAAAVTAVVATPGIHSVPLPKSFDSAVAAARRRAATSPATGAALPGRGSTSWQPPNWLTALVGSVCVLLAVLLVGLLIWQLVRMWLRDRAMKLAAAQPVGAVMAARRAAVLAAVDASIAELASEDGDARSAVIACWVRLEEVAALAGTEREPGDTPAELVARLLRAHQVSAPVLHSLAELYRTARFSTRTIESSMREQARAALGQLRDDLAHSRSGPVEADPPLAGTIPVVRRPSPSASQGPQR